MNPTAAVRKLTLLALSTLLPAAAALAAEIQIFYTNNPPLICAKNGELDCIAGNLLKAAAKAGGHTLKHSEVPWARAKEQLEQVPNALFAATGRNEFTEKQFNWYFPVYSDDVFVFTLRDQKIASEADLKGLGKINVRRGSPFVAYLEKRGMADKVYETNDWTQGAQMLDAGRVDAMCLTGLIGRTNIIDLQKVADSQVNRFKVGDIGWYIITKPGAVSPDLESFRKLLEAEKAKPAFQSAIKSFGVRS
jgi:ABC-type amino acid transport substrate-binding protein